VNVAARLVAPPVTVGLALLAGTAFGGDAAAQTSCDPAYVSHCVPPVWEVGDLNCDVFYAQGITNIQLADPNNDPHGLDGWNYVDDGWGCEGEGY
jgi:hypothetical protein